MSLRCTGSSNTFSFLLNNHQRLIALPWCEAISELFSLHTESYLERYGWLSGKRSLTNSFSFQGWVILELSGGRRSSMAQSKHIIRAACAPSPTFFIPIRLLHNVIWCLGRSLTTIYISRLGGLQYCSWDEKTVLCVNGISFETTPAG